MHFFTKLFKGPALSLIIVSYGSFAAFIETTPPSKSQENISSRRLQGFYKHNLKALPEPAADDSLYTLLKQQTDKFSDASDHADTTVMGSLVDDDLLFSNGSGNVYTGHDLGHGGDDVVRDQADATSVLLKQRTQAFIDAGQRSDVAAMKGYLDPNVLFINADGVLSESRDFASGAIAAPPKGVLSKITVTDWVLHHSGDVAVACYIEDQVSNYNGQVLNEKFRTVEAWIKHNAMWRLIGSETIPFHQDPPIVTLPPDELNNYTGAYVGATGAPVTISINGNELAITRDGKATPLVAELRDVFLTPGEPSCYARSRYIFQRDPGGHVIGYMTRSAGGDLISRKVASRPQGEAATQQKPTSTLTIRDFVVHRSGDVAIATLFHDRVIRYAGQVLKTTYRSSETWVKRGTAWKMITSQGRALQVDPPIITIAPTELNDYVGVYTIGRGFTVTTSRAGNALASSTNGAKVIPLDAEVRDVFFTPGSPRSRVIFQRDSAGQVIGYVRRSEGRDLVLTKTS